MLSIIIPVFNEHESLVQLHAEITQVCVPQLIEHEIIFVDDGSKDGSWQIIQQLSQSDPRVSGIRFRRNFGKAAALTAGLSAAKGDLLMMMDADLQDDPIEIPRFLARIQEGFDVVNGWKVRRLDPWHKVYPSKVFNWMVSRLTGLKLHDHNCGFKGFRKEVAGEIRLYGELHRFVPVLAFARGFSVSEIEVHHRSRQFGYSKYGFNRFVRGFLDLLTVKFLTGFGQRPQHLLGTTGLICFGAGTLGLIYLACVWMFGHALNPLLAQIGLASKVWVSHPIGGRPLLAYSVATLLLGAQLLSLGFLAELIVANTSRETDTFSIADRTHG
ncbi:MAG: glycosyl transferase family 2 [Planctomycetaceae bacterium]|nr:glycosyl transferase family 2 [Planctomycetaceae bacterium]